MFSAKVQVAILFCCVLIGKYWGEGFHQDDVLGYVKNIKDQGMAIFTIFGIWIALIFPEELRRLKDNEIEKTELSKIGDRFDNELIYPLLIGTFTLAICLVFDVTFPIMKSVVAKVPDCRYFCFWAGKSLILFAYVDQILSLAYSVPIVLGIKWKVKSSAGQCRINSSLPPIQK